MAEFLDVDSKFRFLTCLYVDVVKNKFDLKMNRMDTDKTGFEGTTLFVCV